MRTANPLLVSLNEASFQLSLPTEEIVALISDGDLTAVRVRGQVLVAYDSLTAFTRRVKRNCVVVKIKPPMRGSNATAVNA
jgi:hypothetical protein